jgi:hypothetical protein
MKKVGSYTARGFMTSNTVERVHLFDGRFDSGYVITKFVILVNDPDVSSFDCFGILSTQEDTGTDWDFRKGQQIAWGSMNNGGAATGPLAEPFNLVDRDNLVIEDLYIYGETNSAGGFLNYYIEMDKYEFTEPRGALAMVRNKQQGQD